MKTLLLAFIIGVCGLAWKSEDFMKLVGLGQKSETPKEIQVRIDANSFAPKVPGGMTLTEYADLAKKDPDAYRKLFASHQQEKERSEIDKLMNFFKTFKYE